MKPVQIRERRHEMTQKQEIRQVLSYVRRYWVLLLASILLAVVSVVLSLYIPVLAGSAIDCIIYENVNFEKMMPILWRIVFCAVGAGLSQWVMNLIHNQVTFRVVRDIRKEAFEKIWHLPVSYLDSHSHGDLVSRIISDVDQFADGLLMGFTQFFTGVVTIAGTLIFMLRIHPAITLVVVLITPLSFFVAGFIAKRTHSMFHLQSQTRGEQTTLIEEMIGNEKVVKAYGREEKVQERFDEINERLTEYSLKAIFFSSLTNPCTRFVNGVVYAGVALAGSLFAISGSITVGALTSFLSYANQYTKPFNEISGVLTELQNALACAGRVFSFLEEDEETESDGEWSGVDTSVELKNASFSYVKENPLITDVSIFVKQGQKVAIVGPTGCGKTTIINLLMRFYDLDAGSIRIGGKEIKSLRRDELRKQYGMVLQETWLKEGTIAENISMGKPEATREEIVEAAKAAYAHSFIERMPDGYDTVIGEDGGMLSQGQKQLLCIARVMLLMPPILILDEATSSIDTRTEQKIQSAFQTMMEGRTSFIVAHRLSTIQNADLILVMKDGNIIEQGNHEELLRKKGFYADLYMSQFL